MESFKLEGQDGSGWVRVPYRGQALINHPMFNKSSAFTAEERVQFGLCGLLPPEVFTLQQQQQRIYENIARKSDPLEKHIGLSALHDRNEVLFHRLVLDHIEEFLPIVYTPTVGQACQLYSHLFRRPRGIWITPAHKGYIYDVLGNAPYDDVRLVVVTDNERILGLGDQGAGGMGIPVGKLVLYTVAAGIHPTQTLPVSLDVGTDNAELRHDDLYLGYRQPRLRGPAYDELVEEFVHALKRRFPNALLQWEDFKKQNAFDLLDRYRDVIPSFNDDIQGTAAVAVAGILAAGRATGTPLERQRVVILGAGAAGVGIARQLRNAMRTVGMSGDQLTRAIAVLDSGGMLLEGRTFKEAAKKEFAWPAEFARSAGFDAAHPPDLLTVVTALRPTILIGTTGEPGVFTESIVRAMAEHVNRPAIFPFSNPTSKSEASPSDLIAWTNGLALVATGSPFPPVVHNGRTIRIGQGNNVYIFPGVGLGALVSNARRVTDEMFSVAAAAVAESVSADVLASGCLYPPLTQLREVSARIAAAVVKVARDSGVGRAIPDGEIEPAVRSAMWTPQYPKYVPA